MDIAEIRDAVRDAVASTAPGCDLQQIRPDLPLREQIDLDSMDWLNLVVRLQERLQIEIPESDAGQLATLDSIVSYVDSRLAQQAADRAPRGSASAPTWPCTRQLADGTAIAVRPLRPEDAPLESELVRNLSADSRYKRFMVTLRELPPGKLRDLTNVDGVRQVALIATVQRDGREVPLGVARYVVDASGASCEFAITVADAWHGSGVAGILMGELIDIARTGGLARMEGLVLATNDKMLKFARQIGFSVQRDPNDRTVMQAVLDL